MNNEKRPTVALIYGGRGRESEVSIKGKAHILPLIDQNTYNVLPIFIDKCGRWLIDEREIFLARGGFYSAESGEFYSIDCAFPLLHGDFGEDGRIQGALECADVPFVGCDTAAGAVCRDKSFVKIIAKSLGIPTLPHICLYADEGVDYAVRQAETRLSYPMFVKPARLGSSVGIGSAESREELISALTKAFSLCDKAVVEPLLHCKRELECGYFRVKGKELFTNAGEILLNGCYDYDKKYLSGDVRLAVRADVDSSVADSIREYSRRLVRTLGVRDLARVDYFLTDRGLYFNEINTMPGFTNDSLYLKMIEAAGIIGSDAINMLVESAISRV